MKNLNRSEEISLAVPNTRGCLRYMTPFPLARVIYKLDCSCAYKYSLYYCFYTYYKCLDWSIIFMRSIFFITLIIL